MRRPSRNSKSGDVMADNDKSKLRYDDFVSNVQPDPAKPESTIMLSGFVGRGQEGHARIYPDPTLGTWYDVPEADIVHSMPIADSKLGGSYVWARASAQIKPGSAAPAATEAPRQAPQAEAATFQPTPATHCFVCDPLKTVVAQPTPTVQTHCFICPPLTQQINCPTQPLPCIITPATQCFICPPPTERVNCPTHPVPCNIPPTPATRCFICPPPQQTAPNATCTPLTVPVWVCGQPTLFCQQPGAQQHPAAMVAAAPPNTDADCTALTRCVICPTPLGTCICTDPQCAQTQTFMPPCTLPAVCLPTMMRCPTDLDMCPTVVTGCFTAPSGLCAPAQAPHAAAAGMQPTPAATDCVQPTPATQCFPFCPTPVWTVNICDTFICNIQPAPHQTPFCTIPPNCPAQTGLVPCPTQPGACTLPVQCYQNTWFGCQQGGAQQHGAAMAAAAPPITAVCTAQACPPSLVCPTIAGACPTVMTGCWTAPSGLCALAPNGVFTPFGR